MTFFGKILGASVIAVAVALGFSGAAGAKSLAQSKAVNDGLVAIGVADEIRKNCPDISARMIKALRYLKLLEKHAKAEGFSQNEIDAYVDNKTQKERLIEVAKAYMRQRGVDGSDASYCKLGREEIARGSRIGSLLRVR